MTVRHAWFPYVAAAAGSILLLKAIVVVTTGDGSSPTAMGILLLVGVLLGLAAAVGAGLRRDSRGARIGVALAGMLFLVAWIMVLSDAVEGITGLVSDSEVVRDEMAIAVAGLALLAIGAFALLRDTRAIEPGAAR